MSPQLLDAWVAGYVRAWTTNDPEDIGRLFAADAVYFTAPFREPLRGRARIVADWLERRDEPGTWTFAYEIHAICDDLGLVRGRAEYAATADDPARTFSNLWEIRLDAESRCTSFTEWWMEQTAAAEASPGSPAPLRGA